ncbi:glycosyltransferase family 9 protein [Acidobacteriota bacterium]
MNKKNGSDVVRAAQQFMAFCRDGVFHTKTLDVVIDAAISENSEQARLGTGVLFGQVVEPLSDTFLIQDRETLHRVMARLIALIRILPGARPFHKKLNQWGLRNEVELLYRMARVSSDKRFEEESVGSVTKVFILSRVTIGADVLLNSPVIEKMKQRFPGAEIVFLGNEKNGRLLKGSQPGVRVRPLHYQRRDVLLNRFLLWLDLVAALENETRELGPGEDYIIVNTDSRLFQSGLLPILPPNEEEKRYFFRMPSLKREEWAGTSQAEDLIQWLETVFGAGPHTETVFPKLHLPATDIDFAKKVYDILKVSGKTFIVSLSLGVGGNQEKRVRFHSEVVSRFEINLIRKLLSDGVTFLLDKGSGAEEYERAETLTKIVREMGFETAEVTEENPEFSREKTGNAMSQNIRLLTFQGGVSKFAALVKASDLYIGYDSLGQHLAGAVGCDVIVVFAGYHSDLFPQRWKPFGSGSIALIKAQCGPFSPERQDELVAEVFKTYKALRRT